MYEQFIHTYRDSASRQVQLFINFVNFGATSLVSISYIFPPTVVLRTLFLLYPKHMLRAHYISMSLAIVIWECSLNQFSTSLFVSLFVNREQQPNIFGRQYRIQGQFSKSQGEISSHFASHVLGLSV